MSVAEIARVLRERDEADPTWPRSTETMTAAEAYEADVAAVLASLSAHPVDTTTGAPSKRAADWAARVVREIKERV